METVFINNRDVALNIAAFLPPKDAYNLLLSSKLMSCLHSSPDDRVLGRSFPSYFMNKSLKTSLLSVMEQREEFREGTGQASSFLSDLENLSRQVGVGVGVKQKVAMSGSLIVQAALNSTAGMFVAGDIDLYTTRDQLPLVRKVLFDNGFVFRRVLIAKYEVFNNGNIHHVEAFSAMPSHGRANIYTFGDALRKNLVNSHTRRVLTGGEYALPLTSPFACDREPGLRKHIDLVVTDNDSVDLTIQNFDISLCRSCFNGVSFRIPEIGRLFHFETRLSSQNWSLLLNCYATMFFSKFPLEEFTPLPLVTRNEALRAKKFQVFLFFRQLKSEGKVLFPDRRGRFCRGYSPKLRNSYFVSLHNALVKIGERIMKYSKIRGFDCVDICVDEFVQHHQREGQADQNFMQQRHGDDGDNRDNMEPLLVHKEPLRHYYRSDIVKRVKILNESDLSSPVARAKIRYLDTNGVCTASFRSLS